MFFFLTRFFNRVRCGATFCLLLVGLIIDAFGELREKEETVTDQLKVVYLATLGRIVSVFSAHIIASLLHLWEACFSVL